MTARTLTATTAFLGIAAMSVIAAVASTAAESRLGLTDASQPEARTPAMPQQSAPQGAVAGVLTWLH
jgi:hypothetical protein